jgi:hypothetical protein
MRRTSKAEQMQLSVAYRMSQGLTIEQIVDLQTIQRHNRRSVSAWERANSYGGDAFQARMDKIQDSAWTKAEKIATVHGWTLEASGLWWSVYRPDPTRQDCRTDIALPAY